VSTRLYYTDSHLTDFEAHVTESGVFNDRPFVVLDQSAFYPTTGGQPHDTGALSDRQVMDVIERESDGAVLHLLDAPLAAGAQVSGRVDWARRLDHMQQHTGQHVLSASFVRLFEIPTVSFHLGTELSTIDLTGTPGAEVIARAEDEANRVVWENRPVSIRFVGAEEAATLPLRKETARGGTLRLIEVEDYDLSACGGTHVTRTGAIGIIAVQAWERYKGGTRVSFVCGGRGLAQFRAARDVVASAVRQLSIQPSELPDAVTRLQGESRELRQQARALAERLATYEADGLARGAEDVGGTRVVCRIVEGHDAAGLKSLAQAIVTRRPGHVAVLVGESRPAVAVAARSADATADCAQVVKALIARFGGKGGGRPEGAQGGGFDAEPEAVRVAAYEILSGSGSPPSSSASR
jgi:alanyl-tRNA synthetase